MTQNQFNVRLSNLVKFAHHENLCPACVLRALLAASEAVVAIAHLDTTALKSHSVDNVVFVPGPDTGTDDTYLPPITARH